MLAMALQGESKEVIFTKSLGLDLAPSILAIAAGCYKMRTREEIRGSGYVVKSLEAALWCFHLTDSFRDAILLAANLGDDADTTAAICGQIAGAHYGVGGIPAGWLEKLAMREDITEIADRLYALGGKQKPDSAHEEGGEP
jgi:ADP-ribosyl-[dinitrogen reductase] hydrolase